MYLIVKGVSMYITEQYMMYQLAYKLVQEDKYDMLHINPKSNEIWLEKQSSNVSRIIRLVHRGFDWKNHLKTDIASVFHRIKKMNKHFIGKNIEVFNVYVTEDEPVDSWESLKKPMMMKDKKSVKMNVFYVTDSNREEEQLRLLKHMDSSIQMEQSYPSEKEQEETLQQYKYQLAHILKSKNDLVKRIFSYGKPRITYALIIINILIFMMLELNGGSTNVETLIAYGAKYNPAILSGEWWRIVTSMFLHIGSLHLLMNMLAIYYLGMAVERIYGSTRFIVIYFIAGIIGSLTSFAFNSHVAAGASGALFGLFGALLYFGVIHKQLFFQTMGKSVIFILLINLGFGFLVPQIDMGAHLGGLIGGFIASVMTSLPLQKKASLGYKMIGFISCLLLVFFLVWYGTNMNA